MPQDTAFTNRVLLAIRKWTRKWRYRTHGRRGLPAAIELTRQIGFDSIDIFADPLEIDAKERRLIRQATAANHLPVVATVCCALGIADFQQARARLPRPSRQKLSRFLL